MKITYEGGMRFTAGTRGHEITLDLPPDKGGTDEGMTPSELLFAAFGACIGLYVVSYLQSVNVDTSGTTVEVTSATAESPRRYGRLDARVTVPAGIPEERRKAALKVAENCVVHQTLSSTPEMTIELT